MTRELFCGINSRGLELTSNRLLKITRLTFKIVLGCIEFFFAFICFYFTVALIFMAIPSGEDLKLNNDVTIYMKSDGIHTDFVFPVKTRYVDWRNVFLPKETKGKDSTFQLISVGWGDQGFFLNTPQWSDLKASTAFDACFYRGKTALHINYLPRLTEEYEHVELKISKKQYYILYKFVLETLRKTNDQDYICIRGRGYWDTDSFYEANGSYGMFFTCNSWINKGLKKANLPACQWTPFNAGIFQKYRS